MIEFPISADPRASIVIVTARDPDRLLSCLTRVRRSAPPSIAVEVVVVLNAAEASVPEALGRAVTGVTIVGSDIALGFAGGINLGAHRARGELLHILHDDAEVSDGWLDPLIAALDRHPEAGLVGSLLLKPDGMLQTAGHLLWRDGQTERPGGAPPDPASGAYPVDYCASASLLVRREAWEAIGGADENFHPAYYVDVDLAMALRRAGYIVMCEPASQVIHASGGTMPSAFRTFAANRNREHFTDKWEEDLLHQEPYAEDSGAHARARRATERRSLAVAAGTRLTPGVAAMQRQPETEHERMRREHLQLRRDVAVKDAYLKELERARVESEAQLERVTAELVGVEAHGATAQRAVVEQAAELRVQRGAAEALRARVREIEQELVDLRRRAQTLDAIEAGGWWQLRGRLLPVLSIVRRITRRARTSRMG